MSLHEKFNEDTFKVAQGVLKLSSTLNESTKSLLNVFDVTLNLCANRICWIVSSYAIFYLAYENSVQKCGDCFRLAKKSSIKWIINTYTIIDYHNQKHAIEKTPMETHRGQFHFIFRIKLLALSDLFVN